MSKWKDDPTGPGKVTEKTVSHADGTTEKHTLRTEDNAKTGDKNDHSHVIETEHPSGRSTAHGHGIRGGERK